MTIKTDTTEAIDPAYRSLYKLGGWAAWIVAALTVSEVIVLSIYPQPGMIHDWFLLFQSHPFIALLDFWVLEIPMYFMFVIVFLALFTLLRRVNPVLMILALSFALLGCGIFLSTNNPFSMLPLSNQYATATTDLERYALLAAGQAILINTNQRAVGGFNMGLFLVSLAGLMVATVMLRSDLFSRSIAYVGMMANSLSLADYLRQAFTGSVIVALLVILSGALLLVIWYVMLGRRLHQLGSMNKETPHRRSQPQAFAK